MAGLRPGTLRGEDHWARYDHAHAAPTGLTTANITTGSPVSIDPDDAAADGVSTALARADHQHQFTSATAVALTKTATAGEGSAGTHARSDHVHSTAALPWGVLGYLRLGGNNSHTADGTTDFTLTVTPDITRLYACILHTQYSLNAAGDWLINAHDAGTAFGRFKRVFSVGAVGDTIEGATCLWLPATGGAHTVDVRVDEIAGAATLQFEADGPPPVAAPREFTIVDIGPR